MHEKKLALPYLARAEQQALKVGIFITTKLQMFDYHFDQISLNHVPERNLWWGMTIWMSKMKIWAWPKFWLELIWVRPYTLLTHYIQKHLQIPFLLTALQNHLHSSKACIFKSFCNDKSGNTHKYCDISVAACGYLCRSVGRNRMVGFLPQQLTSHHKKLTTV